MNTNDLIKEIQNKYTKVYLELACAVLNKEIDIVKNIINKESAIRIINSRLNEKCYYFYENFFQNNRILIDIKSKTNKLSIRYYYDIKIRKGGYYYKIFRRVERDIFEKTRAAVKYCAVLKVCEIFEQKMNDEK